MSNTDRVTVNIYNGGTMTIQNFPVQYKYTSTKEYIDAFPCAYRQWRANSHCNLNHGYSFSMKFYFGADELNCII